MERVCLLLFLLVLHQATESSGTIYFPGQLDHAEGDDCLTSSGRLGICSRSCGTSNSVSREKPMRCGIADFGFLVCCNKIINTGPISVALVNIGQPSVTFECGKNARELLSSHGFSEGSVLRPEASTPPSVTRVEDLNRPVRSIPDPETLDYPEFFTEEAIGGIISKKNAWPWMALIGEKDGEGIRWFCGGVLINELWVLSALHCFFHNNAEVVRLGEHNYNDDFDGADHQDFGVAESVFYPDFTFGEAYHDLALLRLDPEVTIQEFISPVCLAWGAESDRNITGQKTTLTGWGDTELGGLPSSILQEVNVNVFPPSVCDRSYFELPHYRDTWPRGIGEETVCAGDLEGGRDACQGDSGGPLVSLDENGRYVLAGIVSRGYGCGHKDYPGLYVNMRHPPYLAWIKKVAFAKP